MFDLPVNNQYTGVFTEMAKRTYQLKRRAERQEETRQRIIEAAVELHETVGGAAATISAIAERAGVERLTVYRHFPNEEALVQACTGHYYNLNPQPDPAQWEEIDDPESYLRAALIDIYNYHRCTEKMSASAERDAQLMSDLREILAPYTAHWEKIKAIAVGKFQSSGQHHLLLEGAIGHAIAFTTWRSLIRDQGLDDLQAVELMMAMVGCLLCQSSPSPFHRRAECP